MRGCLTNSPSAILQRPRALMIPMSLMLSPISTRLYSNPASRRLKTLFPYIIHLRRYSEYGQSRGAQHQYQGMEKQYLLQRSLQLLLRLWQQEVETTLLEYGTVTLEPHYIR